MDNVIYDLCVGKLAHRSYKWENFNEKIKWLFVMMVFVTVGAVCIAFIVKNEKISRHQLSDIMKK